MYFRSNQHKGGKINYEKTVSITLLFATEHTTDTKMCTG